MVSGTVKFFSTEKGFGFIKVEGFNADAFVHISVLQKANINNLKEGQKVMCEVDYTKKEISCVLAACNWPRKSQISLVGGAFIWPLPVQRY